MWDSDSHVIRLWSSWWLVGKSRNSHRPSALNQACSLKSNIESKSNNMVDPSCFLWKLGSFWSIKWGSLSPETTSCFSFFYPVELAKFLNLAMLFLATVSLSHAYPMHIPCISYIKSWCGCQKKSGRRLQVSTDILQIGMPVLVRLIRLARENKQRVFCVWDLFWRKIDLCLFEGKLIWIVEVLEVSSLKSDLKGRINSIQTAMQCSFRCSLMMWRLYACSGTTWRNGLAVALRALGYVCGFIDDFPI